MQREGCCFYVFVVVIGECEIGFNCESFSDSFFFLAGYACGFNRMRFGHWHERMYLFAITCEVFFGEWAVIYCIVGFVLYVVSRAFYDGGSLFFRFDFGRDDFGDSVFSAVVVYEVSGAEFGECDFSGSGDVFPVLGVSHDEDSEG